MRPLPAFLGVAVLTLILVACSGDQPATTAPSTTPSFAFKHGSVTFSLSCSGNVGSSTGAVVFTVSGSQIGELRPLACDGSDGPISNFVSFNYTITVTDGTTNQPVAVCQNIKPIRSPGSITCQNATGTLSATLTVS